MRRNDIFTLNHSVMSVIIIIHGRQTGSQGVTISLFLNYLIENLAIV